MVGPGAPNERSPAARSGDGVSECFFFKAGLGDVELENIEHALLVAKAA